MRPYHAIDILPPVEHDHVLEYDGGIAIRVCLRYDEFQEPPWEQSEGHGPVSEWRYTNQKRAGERILCRDESSSRFYDFAAAVKIAKKEWVRDADVGLDGIRTTRGQRAVEAVESDFKFLKGFCDGDWAYVGLIVKLCRVDEDGDVTEEIAYESCYGYEHGDGIDPSYLNSEARSFAAGLLWKHRRIVRQEAIA